MGPLAPSRRESPAGVADNSADVAWCGFMTASAFWRPHVAAPRGTEHPMNGHLRVCRQGVERWLLLQVTACGTSWPENRADSRNWTFRAAPSDMHIGDWAVQRVTIDGPPGAEEFAAGRACQPPAAEHSRVRCHGIGVDKGTGTAASFPASRHWSAARASTGKEMAFDPDREDEASLNYQRL